jgi:hypothetical protein
MRQTRARSAPLHAPADPGPNPPLSLGRRPPPSLSRSPHALQSGMRPRPAARQPIDPLLQPCRASCTTKITRAALWGQAAPLEERGGCNWPTLSDPRWRWCITLARGRPIWLIPCLKAKAQQGEVRSNAYRGEPKLVSVRRGCSLGCSSLPFSSVHSGSHTRPGLWYERLRTLVNPLRSDF